MKESEGLFGQPKKLIRRAMASLAQLEPHEDSHETAKAVSERARKVKVARIDTGNFMVNLVGMDRMLWRGPTLYVMPTSMVIAYLRTRVRE
jgi:hypothetical protein